METVLVIFLSLFVVNGLAAKPRLCVPKGVSCADVDKLKLNITCVTLDVTSCAAMVVNDKADLGLASADDIVANVGKVKLVLAEKYDGLPDFIRYYGVAVVKNTSALNMTGLRGTKTCHTGAGKTAGWKIPIGYLLREKLMPWVNNQYESAASFFKESCVPGIKEIVKDNSITDKLCKLCKSDCTSSDTYAGYDGAYKCMTDGAGEVAFVKHDTPTNKTNKLLCTDGTTKGVDQFESCNIGNRPAGAFVTGSSKGDSVITMYRSTLRAVDVSDWITAKVLKQGVVNLTDVNETPKKYLGDYYNNIKALGVFTSGGSAIAVCLSLQLLAALYFFVI